MKIIKKKKGKVKKCMCLVSGDLLIQAMPNCPFHKHLLVEVR